ncbi:hypothetical protein B0J17DRAFT_722090 [Rhizoctonia solani]|nr:hypothetical protein B0J17DRAFT_722090 [Rhizoctonia solani]
MSANRSENYHFRRGDVTLLVNDISFKLHCDVLESHSEYFRNLFTRVESGDEQSISNEHPLVIPADICSVDSFERICSFLYPRAIGVFPAILVQDLEIWDSVLRATVSLGMAALRKYILSKLEEDTASVSTTAAKLLGNLSASEVVALGGQATAQVTAIRDRIRILIVTSFPYWTTIQTHYLCGGTNCREFIHEGIFNNIKDMDPLNELYQSDSSIFDISQDNRICGYCDSIRGTLARTMAKQELETEIQRCAIGLGLLKVGDEGSQ